MRRNNKQKIGDTPIDADGGGEKLPVLFATIHWRSESRPDGWTSEEVEDLNIEANRHIPELYKALKEQRDQRLRDRRSGAGLRKRPK